MKCEYCANYLEGIDSCKFCHFEPSIIDERYMKIETNNSLNTVFGKCIVNKNGYYVVSSSKEGNRGKLLHRLIIEDFYNIDLEEEKMVVHHLDGNKLNNKLNNLIPMDAIEHIKYHNSLCSNNYENKIKISKSNKNSTGFLGIDIHKTNQCKQGFRWRYRYSKDGNRYSITNVNLFKLFDMIENIGQEVIVIDIEKANKSLEYNNRVKKENE